MNAVDGAEPAGALLISEVALKLGRKRKHHLARNRKELVGLGPKPSPRIVEREGPAALLLSDIRSASVENRSIPEKQRTGRHFTLDHFVGPWPPLALPPAAPRGDMRGPILPAIIVEREGGRYYKRHPRAGKRRERGVVPVDALGIAAGIRRHHDSSGVKKRVGAENRRDARAKKRQGRDPVHRPCLCKDVVDMQGLSAGAPAHCLEMLAYGGEEGFQRVPQSLYLIGRQGIRDDREPLFVNALNGFRDLLEECVRRVRRARLRHAQGLLEKCHAPAELLLARSAVERMLLFETGFAQRANVLRRMPSVTVGGRHRKGSFKPSPKDNRCGPQRQFAGLELIVAEGIEGRRGVVMTHGPAAERPRNRPEAAAAGADVMLVSLPFGMLESPSLGLGILQARLLRDGIAASTRHFTLDYARRIGTETYRRLAAGFPSTTDLLGEWIFSHAIAPKSPKRRNSYLDALFGEAAGLPEASGQIHPRELARFLADDAARFADEVAAEILEQKPRIVGFTSVFQQNCASIAVAIRLRELSPETKLLVGGANCEGPMGRELSRSFPCFDFVVSGEADLIIVPLVRHLLAGEDPSSGTDIHRHAKAGEQERFIEGRMVGSLDDYPWPSFDEFLDEFGRTLAPDERPRLHIPMESSRGCWWGEKNHCSFCGLNGSTMAFRSRPAADVIDQLRATGAAYRGAKISFVDNIMDYRYYDEVLAKVALQKLELDLFYEIKANVTKAQLQTAHSAGLRHIQPGIESLSDTVLKMMRKGVRAIQNVQLLKWCEELGIQVDWNILWGFEGEPAQDYAAMAELVPLICHLPPPARGSAVRLDRFSPDYREAAERRPGLVRPYRAYADVYEQLDGPAIDKLAYFFEDESRTAASELDYTVALARRIDEWRTAYRPGALVHIAGEDDIALFDSRPLLGAKRQFVLSGLEAKLYAACESAKSVSQLHRDMARDEDAISAALDSLCDRQIMWSDGERYLALSACLSSMVEYRATKSGAREPSGESQARRNRTAPERAAQVAPAG